MTEMYLQVVSQKIKIFVIYFCDGKITLKCWFAAQANLLLLSILYCLIFLWKR